jgi:hypothetical protein
MMSGKSNKQKESGPLARWRVVLIDPWKYRLIQIATANSPYFKLFHRACRLVPLDCAAYQNTNE